MIKKTLHTSVIKKQSHDYELIAMAYHEAGHAICCLYNCMKVFNVTVMQSIKSKDKSGITEYVVLFNFDEIKDNYLRKILLLFELQVSYAGLIAEKIYYKDICGSDNFPMHLRIGSSGDINSASKIIDQYNLATAGRDRFIFKKQVQQDTEDILLENWEAVKLIAHQLYKKKKLSFQELKALLTKKTENSDFWIEKFKRIKLIHYEKNISNESLIKSVILKDAIFSV